MKLIFKGNLLSIILLLLVAIELACCKEYIGKGKIKIKIKKNALKSKLRLRHKAKHKKCNPYKNGPAEWKKVDYINANHENKKQKYDFKGDFYYPNKDNLDKYDNEFGNVKASPYYYTDGNQNQDNYNDERITRVYTPEAYQYAMNNNYYDNNKIMNANTGVYTGVSGNYY